MALGLDYSAGYPGGKAMKEAGYEFSLSYLWFQGQQHNTINADKIADMLANGIACGAIWETYANRAADGYQAGVDDARKAQAQVASHGYPDMTVYATIDFDMAEWQKDQVVEYFRGFCDVLGKQRVGVYGGYWGCKAVLDAGYARYGWQTLAWSGGNRDERCALYQNGRVATVGGVSCDLNDKTGPSGLLGEGDTGVSAQDVTQGLFDTRVDFVDADGSVNARNLFDAAKVLQSQLDRILDALAAGGTGEGGPATVTDQDKADIAKLVLDGLKARLAE